MWRRGTGRGVACATVAAGLLLAAGRAEAAPPDAPPYVLTYAAPDPCTREARFISNVASHVHDTSRAWSVRVNVTIEQRDRGYVGTLVAYDPTGKESSRRIEDKKCSDLADALAFLAALVIELGGHTEPEALPVPIPTPPPAPPPPPPSPPTPSSDSAAARPRSFPLSAVILGGARGGLGPSVHPSGEAAVEVAASRGVLAPALRVAGFVGNGSFDGTGGSAALWLAGGRLELCPLRFGNAPLVVRPCLGTEIGVVQAAAQTAFAPRNATEPWISAEATLHMQWFATRSWFLELGGGPVLPLARTRYYFEPDRTLYTVPVVTARAAMGIGLLF